MVKNDNNNIVPVFRSKRPHQLLFIVCCVSYLMFIFAILMQVKHKEFILSLSIMLTFLIIVATLGYITIVTEINIIDDKITLTRRRKSKTLNISSILYISFVVQRTNMLTHIVIRSAGKKNIVFYGWIDEIVKKDDELISVLERKNIQTRWRLL